MKTLKSFTFCALVTPAIALSSGTVLAEQGDVSEADRGQHSEQPDNGAARESLRSAPKFERRD